MTGDRLGHHRAAIRRIVAEAEGNQSQAVPRLNEWYLREIQTGGDEFLFSLLTEFEVPLAAFRDAWRSALEESGDDPDSERFSRILREQLDRRENPTNSETVKQLIASNVAGAVQRVFSEEILKYHGDRGGRD